MASRNATGHLYKKGKDSTDLQRMEVMELYHKGLSFGEISKKCGLSKSGCFKVVKRANELQSLRSRQRVGSSRTVCTLEVITFIEYMKSKSPSIQENEIREKLLEYGVCTHDNLPCKSSIGKVIRGELGMTRKVLQQVPSETTSDRHEALLNNFLSAILVYNPNQIHFFDECSIIRTSGNRRYGHSERGTCAFEVQRYASNATYTLNLLCSYFELGHFEIIEGASNALEMLDFFQRATQERNSVGNPVLNPGDVVVMDNCGFHHHRVYEGRLRNMLAQIGVELLFQPPYSPELNVCEYVFHLMRGKLQKHPELTFQYTELAITRALTKLNSATFPQIYKKCGYV